ncbi:DUF4870 domain-containing protein [Chitinibacteraceae bacterium HSL-7]
MTDFTQMTEQPSGKPSSEATTFSVLTWIGTLIFSFIPPLIVYLIKKDDAFVSDHAKEALNWSITVILASVIGSFLTVILVGFLILGAAWLANLIFCIIAAVKASNGETYRAPFCLRLIK